MPDCKILALARIAVVLAIFLTPRTTAQAREESPVWLEDYAEAVQLARNERKLLLLHFQRPQAKRSHVPSTSPAIAGQTLEPLLKTHVCARLPLDAAIEIGGKSVALLAHPAIAELNKSPGIAVIDYASTAADYYGGVVTVVPGNDFGELDPRQLRVVLSLPPGSLTQRTLIYAVRMHPEGPASTSGDFHPVLAEEAQSHSQHQASIRLQGHHQWGSRFQRILGRLRGASDAREVCAESWPGQSLLAAAEECVHSWRQSPGHWEAVRSPHGSFAYDMKRGANGIWYATGIFSEARLWR